MVNLEPFQAIIPNIGPFHPITLNLGPFQASANPVVSFACIIIRVEGSTEAHYTL